MARSWESELSLWELCQFSFNYFTWGLDPHYHNKLYFYQHVQTEAAFLGIRLSFTSVFLGNTILLPMVLSPHRIIVRIEHAARWISYLHWSCTFLCQNVVHSICRGYCRLTDTEWVCFHSWCWLPWQPAKRYMAKTSLSDHKQNQFENMHQVLFNNTMKLSTYVLSSKTSETLSTVTKI